MISMAEVRDKNTLPRHFLIYEATFYGGYRLRQLYSHIIKGVAYSSCSM